MISIPTEPIGSIPRPLAVIEARKAFLAGQLAREELDALCTEAIRDTIRRFEDTGSPVVSDGEQAKFQNFASYPIDGLPDTRDGGFVLNFADGHGRPFPVLTSGPFRYTMHADRFLELGLRFARRPVKQAVIAPSFQSLFYPPEDIPGYSRERFVEDLLEEHEREVRSCLQKGAHVVQVDFTEGRLAMKLDPSGDLLRNFIQLNNLALSRFSPQERQRIGVHTCPGGDCDSTHSADVDYGELLPMLFELQARSFYMELAREPDRARVLRTVRDFLKPHQRVFVGVIDPLDPRVESAEEVRDRVLEAAEFIPLAQLGTTDDCGFAPFSDDVSTTRDTAFAKVRARVEGTVLAAAKLDG
jgi:5-methyltetrahydropteroyltriglutamate--homocysteine methyltransferase